MYTRAFLPGSSVTLSPILSQRFFVNLTPFRLVLPCQLLCHTHGDLHLTYHTLAVAAVGCNINVDARRATLTGGGEEGRDEDDRAWQWRW